MAETQQPLAEKMSEARIVFGEFAYACFRADLGTVGTDFPAGDDPDAEKRALEEQHCDPATRELFIAALSSSA